MIIHEVVKKLIGPIQPIGKTSVDQIRFNNLQQMTRLIDLLLGDVDRVSVNKGRPEHSMNKAGEYAVNFVDDIMGSD
jgi:hypothetical protein